MEPNLQAGCRRCKAQAALGFSFTMAFQPIVNVASGQIFAHEALVRGVDGQSAAQVLAKVNADNRYPFDQACRVKAIELAARLHVQTFLSINFMPKAIYQPAACIQATLAAAERFHFRTERIIFEFNETEQVDDNAQLKDIVDCYREFGFWTAIDDFGAGHAGLNLLVDVRPDIVKLDMHLVRGIDQCKSRQAVVNKMTQLCRELHVEPVAEGIETYEEFQVVRDFGIELVQGYYFAKPAIEALAAVAPEKLQVPSLL